MQATFRLYFQDVDGHCAYVGQTKNISQILPSFFQFTCFTTDIKLAAKFDEESCAIVKKLLEDYYTAVMENPFYLTMDRVF